MFTSSAATPKISVLAVVSMVIAIAGCIFSFAFGGALGIAAVILAAIARSRINANPTRLGGAGYASAGVTAGIVSMALSVFFITGCSSTVKVVDTADNRRQCAANLTGLLKAANVYAADNGDDFPMVMPPKKSVISFGGGVATGGSADLTISGIYMKGEQQGNMTANLWLLALKGYTAPRQYICPSDPANKVVAVTTSGGSYYNNFPGVENISYSMAVPWNAAGEKIGFWKSIVDAGLPLMADMAPQLSGNVNANSVFHNGEGQIVGWSDAHASFEKRPDIGYNRDNIWTTSGGSGPSPAGTNTLYGAGAASGGTTGSNSGYVKGGESQNWDVIMAPARGADGKTY